MFIIKYFSGLITLSRFNVFFFFFGLFFLKLRYIKKRIKYLEIYLFIYFFKWSKFYIVRSTFIIFIIGLAQSISFFIVKCLLSFSISASQNHSAKLILIIATANVLLRKYFSFFTYLVYFTLFLPLPPLFCSDSKDLKISASRILFRLFLVIFLSKEFHQDKAVFPNLRLVLSG